MSLPVKITAIKAGRNPRVRRSNIFLDGRFAFSLDNEVIVKESLKVGQEISREEIAALTGADLFQRCLNAAFHFLSFRPRSESEVRERLERQGYDIENIEKVLLHLKRLSLINDTAFAEFWKENRSSFRPRSQRMIKQELRRKGLETDVIEEAVENIDDSENAYRAALNKARHLSATDFPAFQQKLGSFLQRRGFSYAVTRATIKRLWQEAGREETSGDFNDQ